MASEVYVLPIGDGGGTLEIDLVDSLVGYPRLAVYIDGTPYEIDNVPSAAPPTGELPVWIDGVEYYVPFAIAASTGLWERAQNSARALLDETFSEALRLSIDYDNGPATQVDANSGSLFARAEIDFSSTDVIAVAGRKVAVRVTGEASVELSGKLGIGDDTILSFVEEAKTALRDRNDGFLRTFEPSSSTLGRDGSRWIVRVLVPFDAQDTFDRATNIGGAAPPVGQAHDVLRSAFDDRIVQAQGLEARWDNSAVPPPDASPWVRVAVATNPSVRADSASRARSTRRYSGSLRCVVHVPLGTGDRDAWRLADTLADAFRAASAYGVSFSQATARRLGRRGKWWTVLVEIPFRVDEKA